MCQQTQLSGECQTGGQSGNLQVEELSLRPRLTLFVLFAALSLAPFVRADSLSTSTVQGGATSVTAYGGQAFTVSGTGSYNNITFSFLNSNGSSVAGGTGYLFSSAFNGTPGQLSASATNLLGTAVAANGLYSFGLSTVLTAGRQYFFYENASLALSAQTGGGSSNFLNGTYTSTSAFQPVSGYTWNYAVNGTAMPISSVTPEPASLLLLGTGLFGVAGLGARRFAGKHHNMDDDLATATAA